MEQRRTRGRGGKDSLKHGRAGGGRRRERRRGRRQRRRRRRRWRARRRRQRPQREPALVRAEVQHRLAGQCLRDTKQTRAGHQFKEGYIGGHCASNGGRRGPARRRARVRRSARAFRASRSSRRAPRQQPPRRATSESPSSPEVCMHGMRVVPLCAHSSAIVRECWARACSAFLVLPRLAAWARITCSSAARARARRRWPRAAAAWPPLRAPWRRAPRARSATRRCVRAGSSARARAQMRRERAVRRPTAKADGRVVHASHGIFHVAVAAAIAVQRLAAILRGQSATAAPFAMEHAWL